MDHIALKMLIGDRVRFLGIVFGLTFAAMLITQQMGIFLGLMSRAYAAVGDIPAAQIWVMDPSMDTIDLGGARGLSATAVDQVRSVPGVAWAVEHLRLPTEATIFGAEGGRRRDCLLIGVDDQSGIGLPRLVEGRIEDLRRDDAVFIDRDGIEKFARTGVQVRVGDTIEVNDHRAYVAGVVEAAVPVWFSPYLYTTATRARSWLPPLRRSTTFVVARAVDGTDPGTVAAAIARRTAFTAVTSPVFTRMSAAYFAQNTGIPITFGTAVVLGFVVGTAIAGLLFFQFTRDNLRYLGALKAMGASNRVLMRMVLLQAGLVGVLGYGFGSGLAALFGYLAGGSQLAWLLPPWLLAATFLAITLITLFAAALSMRTVIRLEPAVVFRG